MTAVKPRDLERAIRQPGAGVQLFLFYGPDHGRAAELARAAASAFVADPADAFQLIRLDGDRVAEQPGRLTEEATTFGLFGGRRAIWVRPTSRNITSAVVACLEVALVDTLIVIEAGDLAKGNTLRLACEASPRALALPCYHDETRDLGALITETLAASGLTIEADARVLLADALGGDRLASRAELEKLALYIHPRNSVTTEDVEAIVSDVATVTLDAALDAAFLGRVEELDACLMALDSVGSGAGSLAVLAVRHALALVAARNALDGGASIDEALRSWRGLHFRRKDAIAAQLRSWTGVRLRKVLAELQRVTLETRRAPNLASAGSHSLYRIAMSAEASQPAARSRRQSASS